MTIDVDRTAEQGRLLKAYREQHNWSQSEASAATGVPVKTWQGWECGKPAPQQRFLMQLLAAALGHHRA